MFTVRTENDAEVRIDGDRTHSGWWTNKHRCHDMMSPEGVFDTQLYPLRRACAWVTVKII